MKKVFLEDLPIHLCGNYKGRINWCECNGVKIRFVYDDIEDVLEIVSYDKNKRLLKLKYNNSRMEINIGNFTKCQIGKLIGKVNGKFKFEVGDTFIDDKRNITIIDREYKMVEQKPNNKGDSYITNYKYYKYICNTCRYCGFIEEGNLLKSKGCPCCSNKVTIEGINDITTTAPWMIDLGVDFEEAKKFVCQSNKRIKCVCPYCRFESYKIISDIYNRKSISCKCGDGYSYISKYIYSVLKQINLEFQTEVKYKWNKYNNPLTNRESQSSIDFVIYYNGREIPLEADGKFHRTDNHMNGQTKEMSECIDKQRDGNCLKYLGEETIRISDEGDIKANILNSKLSELFDLTQIDWLKCEEYAINSNKVKEVCNAWNNKEEWETTTDLCNKFNISKTVVLKYLKNGSMLGWVKNYHPKEEMKKSAILRHKTNKKQVNVLKNGIDKGVFPSIRELANESEKVFGVKFQESMISVVANGLRDEYKGYKFKFI